MSRAARVRTRLEERAPKKSREALLEEALLDWRSGRAFVRGGKHHTYWLRPLVVSEDGRVSLGYGGRPRAAPWSKVANEVWGKTTEFLHRLSHERYPEETQTAFERNHALDPVRPRLLKEIARREGLAP